MKQISSSHARLAKKLYPIIWFGLLTAFLVVAFDLEDPSKSLLLIAGVAGMSAFGYFLMGRVASRREPRGAATIRPERVIHWVGRLG